MTKNKRGEIVAALLLDVEELTLIVAALLSLRESGVLDGFENTTNVMIRLTDQIEQSTIN